MKLYTYYRSSAAYRVRIALNYKKIDHQLVPINLLTAQHQTFDYKMHNPQGRVPTLVDGDFEFGQSSAILEYLEETHPELPLLPTDIKARAWIRFLSQIIISDIHPLNNSSVTKFMQDSLNLDSAQIKQWYHHWIKQGFDTLETLLAGHPDCNHFCWGNTPTLADICLIPQIYNAERFEFTMDDYPTLRRINKHCLSLSCFENAKPENQIDNPTS